MKVAIYTLGCKVNQYETQAMEQELLARGHTLTEFSDEADAYIVNTCSVTAVSDQKSRQVIHGAELQQQPFSGRNFGKLNRAEVPQIFFWKQLPLHAGRIALRGKRNENFSVPLFWHFLRFRERILPPSVQICPVFPAHLRTRIFRKRELFFRIFPKFRRKAEFFSFLFSNL